MRGVYKVLADFAAVAAAQGLVYVQAPATMVLEIVDCYVSDRSITAQAEYVYTLSRITAVGPLAGSAITPQPTENGDKGASFTAKTITTEATTYVDVSKRGTSDLIGFNHEPTDPEKIYVPPSGYLAVRIVENPAAAVNLTVELAVREIG